MIPMVQIMPSDPVRLARTVPLSLWPVHVRNQLERRRKGMELALRRLEDLREEMIDKLDALTIDADLEPSLGAPAHPDHLSFGGGWRIPGQAFDWSRGSADDREADGGYLRSGSTDADHEPSLGSPEAATVIFIRKEATRRRPARMVAEFGLDQTKWARGDGGLEEEPSLGFSEPHQAAGTQVYHASHDRSAHWLGDDLEHQCEDEGSGDVREPDADEEPELGSLDRQADQQRWSAHDEGWRTLDGEVSAEV